MPARDQRRFRKFQQADANGQKKDWRHSDFTPLSHKLAFISYKRSYASKYLPLLGIAEEPNYNPTLDCMVIGSDEVFNCIQKNTNVGFSPELFGAGTNAGKVITYAASFGNTTIDKLRKYGKAEEIAGYLNDIAAISVRDANSGSIIRELTSREPVYYLDPVLAYDYFGKCDRIPEIHTNEKYLILYAYSGRITDAESDWIKSYAKRKGLKVYAIGGVQKCADRFVDCSPFEVLAYFKNAEEVITDTFHGSIFSVISQRPFTTIVRKSVGAGYGNEEKLTDLLNRLGLTDRMTFDVSETERINQKLPDYTNVQSCLEEQRKRTKRLSHAKPRRIISNTSERNVHVHRTENLSDHYCVAQKYGIKHCVLSAGSRNVPFVHSIEEDPDFHCYSVVDERSAGYFALGLAQELNEPVVISCTSSTATCNYWPPVAEAFYQDVPIVVLTSDRDPEMLGQWEDQMIDQVGMYDRHVRKSVNLPIIHDHDDEIYCQRLVNEALLELNHHGTGPVHINVPMKSYNNSFNIKKLPEVTKFERLCLDSEKALWDTKIETLKKAKRILVTCGQNSYASPDLKKSLSEFFKNIIRLFPSNTCRTWISKRG